jgi:hypothetical protein
VNAYPIYPARSIPKWVAIALASLGGTFVIVTVAVMITVVHASSSAAEIPVAALVAAPAPAAPLPVSPGSATDADDEAPVRKHRAIKRRPAAVKRPAAVVLRGKNRPHKKDDLDTLLGL